MPTYDYRCAKCGHQMEAFHKISDEPLRKCPKCGEATLEKQFGKGAGFAFKGSGFYINDYGINKNSAPATESTAPSCCPCGKNKSACSSTDG